jgi:DICT domain-containing protein
MGVPEIESFLTYLAVEGNVTASTQNQALNAIVFLYRHVLQQELDDRINAIRAKRSQHLPVVLAPEETFAKPPEFTKSCCNFSMVAVCAYANVCNAVTSLW